MDALQNPWYTIKVQRLEYLFLLAQTIWFEARTTHLLYLQVVRRPSQVLFA